MRTKHLFIAVTISALFGLLNISVAQEHNQQKPEQQSTKPHDQAKDVYTCPMHPDVVSNMPGKCPQCGMTLQKKKPVSDQEDKMSEMMKKPTYEQSRGGMLVQVWVIAQDEHKEMMEKRMKDEKGAMGAMKHDMMQGDKDSTKAGHQMGGMMMHQKKDKGQTMGKDAKHDMKEGEPMTMMKAMMEGTHHVMVRVLDEKTKKEVADASVQFISEGSSGKTSTVSMAGMMDHFGGGVTMGEEGEYNLTVVVKTGESAQKVQFTYKHN